LASSAASISAVSVTTDELPTLRILVWNIIKSPVCSFVYTAAVL
jgi:hypothetical protein